MLSSVLRSDRAIAVNIEIMRAFVKLREMVSIHEKLSLKLEGLERKYDEEFKMVFGVLRQLLEPPQKLVRLGLFAKIEAGHSRIHYKQALFSRTRYGGGGVIKSLYKMG